MVNAPGSSLAAGRRGPMPLLAERYQLGEVVGRGGMAEVYRAVDVRLHRPVAVKMLLDRAGDESDRARFISEARTLARLSHSGLVTVLDAGFGVGAERRARPGGEEADQPFLVMELIEGPTLGQLMKRGPMPVDDLEGIAVQIADALAYVHSRGVVHRDVKPGNVLLGEGGTVKLADFGIARLVEQHTRHTGTGLTMGTAAYIAPEQVRGGAVDGAADVYALGLVLLEAITGRREYAGAPAEAALARLHRPPVVPPLPRWQELLTAMTALEPGERPGAGDVAATLRAGLRRPAPVSTAREPDAVTSPILASTSEHGGPSDGTTRPLTEAVPDPLVPALPPPVPVATPAPPPAQPPTAQPISAVHRAGDAIARDARRLVAHVRGLPAETLGLVGVAVAVLVLFVVMAVVGSNDDAAAIPDNTPADLRQPLDELHRAVNGEDG